MNQKIGKKNQNGLKLIPYILFKSSLTPNYGKFWLVTKLEKHIKIQDKRMAY